MDRKDQPRIGVVCGGSSPEAEVSRRSAEAVAEALKSTYRAVRLMELDQMLPWTLVEGRVDVVFPALHGPPGEDGTFQGFLEIAGIPYVGSGVVASALAMDKVAAKGIFRTHELPVAPDLVVSRQEGSQAAARRVADRLGTDVVIKPSSQGSALGVRFARDLAGIQAAVEGAFQYDTRVLVEEKICGKEITVGILEREEATALPVIEIRTPEGTWYDYEHRYTPGLSEHVIPAGLTPDQSSRVSQVALQAHQSLGCRDLSRVDLIVPPAGEPVLIEVNSMPGMTATSLYPDAARAAGLTFPELAVLLVQKAWSRRGAGGPDDAG